MTDTHYDIFISYRTIRRPWVEVLAQNLQAQGYKVFLDAWELTAGDAFTHKIFSALDHSRFALLIATPEAAESGWVQQEYDYMFNLSMRREDFRWIPVVLGEFPDFPFLANIQAVDFGDSTPETYRIAFQKLLCGLEQAPPGAKPYFADTLHFPPIEPIAARELVTHEHTFLDAVCGRLEAGTPLMVLAQADTSTQHYAHALKQAIAERHPHETLLHLFPPASVRADSSAYFGRLATQCGFAGGLGESWVWADGLRERLDSEALVLLVNGFENGSEECRAELAGELRGLLEEYPQRLKLVMLGSERLAAMKYQHGAMSLLNLLEEMRLPETGLQDMREIYLQRYPGLQLEDTELQAMLAFTGHHPRLLEACLQASKQGQDWQTSVRHSPLPSQLFTLFRAAPDAGALCGLLKRETLGRYDAWPQDELLRRLYWQNLITHCAGQFVWRCAFIRETGREMLGCGDWGRMKT